MLICAPILFELMFYFALCNLKGNLLLLFRLNVAELQLFNWVGDWLHITLQNTVTLFWIELLEVCNSIYKYLISERLRQSFWVIVLLKPLRFWWVVRSYITSSYLLLLFLSFCDDLGCSFAYKTQFYWLWIFRKAKWSDFLFEWHLNLN